MIEVGSWRAEFGDFLSRSHEATEDTKKRMDCGKRMTDNRGRRSDLFANRKEAKTTKINRNG